jgi:putative heme iron utilization protein
MILMCSQSERTHVHARTNHERTEDAMAKSPTRTTDRTAEQAYAEHAATIATLLAAIQLGLERHATQFSMTYTNRRNWGFVGDITAVENSLREIAETMPQVDDADLAERR